MANFRGTSNRIGKGMDEMMTLVGDAGLKLALSEMKESSVRTILRGPIRAGASLVSKEAKRLVPEGDKNLKRSIGVQVKTSKRKGTVYGKIHIRRGYGKGSKKHEDPYFYGLMVEFGTGPRVQKTTGRRTGAIAPRPFMRRALSEKRAQVLSVITSKTKASLRKVARKAALKGKAL